MSLNVRRRGEIAARHCRLVPNPQTSSPWRLMSAVSESITASFDTLLAAAALFCPPSVPRFRRRPRSQKKAVCGALTIACEGSPFWLGVAEPPETTPAAFQVVRKAVWSSQCPEVLNHVTGKPIRSASLSLMLCPQECWKPDRKKQYCPVMHSTVDLLYCHKASYGLNPISGERAPDLSGAAGKFCASVNQVWV